MFLWFRNRIHSPKVYSNICKHLAYNKYGISNELRNNRLLKNDTGTMI